MKSSSRLLAFVLCFSTPVAARAQSNPSAAPKGEQAQAANPAPEVVEQAPKVKSLKDRLGITLTSQFAGPALEFSPKTETFNSSTGRYSYSGVGAAPPTSIGSPAAEGYQAFNLVSLRFKNLFGNYALDVQTRFRLVFNDDRFPSRRAQTFQVFRWEAPRFGISGRLFGGESWMITGALNSDLPYTFPEPFTGFQAKGRTLLATPGMFANLRVAPAGTRFSFFSILNPRFLIYEDRNAAEAEFLSQGLSGDMKAEFVIQVWPTLNYKLSDIWDLSLGTALTIEKQVQSSWNPFVGVTQILNERSDKWRIRAVP
ncbi:MAG: hypothetical protein K2X47_18750, partial [Bdellovibrionales bacterium]|nr:hypothetical protein [Bdellovibrionales bacterium]